MGVGAGPRRLRQIWMKLLPDMGPVFQGAHHLRVEDLAEMVVAEAAEPSA